MVLPRAAWVRSWAQKMVRQKATSWRGESERRGRKDGAPWWPGWEGEGE